MAALPDKEKLLRNFLRCANWEEKYLYIIELGQRLPELNDDLRCRKIAFRDAKARYGLLCVRMVKGLLNYRATVMRQL